MVVCVLSKLQKVQTSVSVPLRRTARINEFGFMETPYRKVDKVNKQVTTECRYLTADEEDDLVIAQAK